MALCRCERNISPPWNISPPSIVLHGVRVMLSVMCRDDSLYQLTTQSYARWTYIPGDFYSYHTGTVTRRGVIRSYQRYSRIPYTYSGAQ